MSNTAIVRFIRKLFLSAMTLPALVLPALAETNEVIINGALRDRHDWDRAGQSVVIRPNAETRFDLATQFRSDPSVTLVSESRSRGFSLPLFRGQDARSSHIFIDDVELQDPFSGVPMVDEIDLRGFGQMSVHKGYAPWNIPVLEPGGVIQFRSLNGTNRIEGGVAHGDAAGDSGWGFARGAVEGASGKLYARRSVTSGAEKYYDDKGTVLNSSDDRMAVKKNNDRQSHQALLTAGADSPYGRYQAIAWAQQSRSGIAAASEDVHSEAKTESRTAIYHARGLWSLWGQSSVRLHAGQFSARRSFNDPGKRIGFSSERLLDVKSNTLKLAVEQDIANVRVLTQADFARSDTTLRSTYEKDVFAPSSESLRFFCGALLDIGTGGLVELKSGIETRVARITDVQGQNHPRRDDSRASGYSVGWSQTWDTHWLYSQWGSTTRAPTLLEILGNGAEIDGSSELLPERVSAAEIGGRSRGLVLSGVPLVAGLDFWTRRHFDMIAIENISATRWRARNKDERHYIGAEGRLDIGPDKYGVESAVSWIKATYVKTGFLVRRIPMWQAVLGPRLQVFDGMTVREQSRYTGRRYDDDSNLRELEWIWTHDVSLDYAWPSQKIMAGLVVSNVTNVVSNRVTDVATGNSDGRQTYRGYAGEPVAGRNWVASLSREF